MKIADGLWSITQRKGGNVHAFLVEDENSGLILIDTLYDSEPNIIWKECADIVGQSSFNSRKLLKAVLLTHSHKSHLGGLAEIVRISHAPVLAGEYEIPIIEGRQKAARVGFKLPRPFSFEVYALQLALNAGIGRHSPVKISESLKEGMRIGPLEVISVPGHTPGCMAFWWHERRVLIAGDTVASWPTVDIGWPTFNLDNKQARRSVGKMAELNPSIVCCGHGTPIVNWASDILKELASKPL